MICLVEDNAAIRETVKSYLELAGFEVAEFSGASGVTEFLAFKRPRLFILDVMLPDGNGFSLAKRIREIQPDAAFLFLTAREAESDRVTGFELGAEDYVVKPFSPRELVLRVQAILRRIEGQDRQAPAEGRRRWSAEGHRLDLDPLAHEAYHDGRPLKLTAVEWKILSYLAERPGRVVSKERILGECLDYSHDGSERTVITHLKNLRAKLGTDSWIETVRGFGYKFSGKPEAAGQAEGSAP